VGGDGRHRTQLLQALHRTHAHTPRALGRGGRLPPAAAPCRLEAARQALRVQAGRARDTRAGGILFRTVLWSELVSARFLLNL
jgi:hypothetical protein